MTKQPVIKIGIISAANIAPSALIKPVSIVQNVSIHGVAARDPKKAEEFAKEHGIKIVYKTYEELLADPDIDAVYNPLPNGLHYEWTRKCIEAGKPCLLEKPSCSNAAETKNLFELAESKKVVLLEALHHRFHPKLHKLREIAQSGKIGDIQRIETRFHLAEYVMKTNDIRYSYELAGGATMDLGTYSISAMRFILGTEPTVTSAQPLPHKHPKIDLEMKASLSFPNDIEGTLDVNLSNPKCERIEAPITVFGTKGSVTMDNYVVINGRPCNISFKLNDGESTPVTDFEDFGGSPTEWTSYAYQLQAFVNKINGKEPHYWMESKDSILQQGVIDAVYEKSGMGKRPSQAGL